MTQINNIHENAVIPARQHQSTSSTAQFQDSLESALAKSAATETKSEQSAALSEPQSTLFNQPAAPPTDVIHQTDSLLGLLESYATSLENPDATLKDLALLVDRMNDKAQQLMVTAKESTTVGNDLKNIAAQAAMTASIEYIKFQRGDFL